MDALARRDHRLHKGIKKEDGRVTGEPYFDEVREESKQAKAQWEKGTLRMASANVDVLEYSDAPELVKPGQYRATVTKSKLTEVSMVDIGGNDNALPLILNVQGKELKLAAGEESESLPLLINNTQKPDEQMDFKAIALKLGLPETATENEILSSIEYCWLQDGQRATKKGKGRNATGRYHFCC